MLFDELVNQLAADLRLAPFPRGADGSCAMRLDDLIYSFHPQGEGRFLVRSRLGYIACDDGSWLARLLEGNLFDDGVGGPALGVDVRGEVFLTQQFDAATLSFARFMERLKRFVDTGEHWAAQLPQPHGVEA